jgi:hypothetical protein
VTAP